MLLREGLRALIAALLAPLSLGVSVPVFMTADEILHGQSPGSVLSLVPLIAFYALLFGYIGFAVFVIPLYALLRLLRQWPKTAMVFAAAVGIFAALVTAQIVGNDWTVALRNLRVLAERPGDWIDPTSLGGALTGVIFWLLIRPGFNAPSNRSRAKPGTGPV